MSKALKIVNSVITLVLNSKIALLIFLEIAIGVVLSVFSIFAFIELREGIFQKEFFSFDEAIINTLYLHRTSLLTAAMTLASFLGKELVIIVTIFLVILFLLKKHQKEAFLFAFILGMDPLITSLLKNLIQRPRPPLHLHSQITQLDYSFPSGHAMGALVFYATFSYFVYHFTRSKKLGTVSFAFSLFLISLIGLSRIYLGVHYPSDVLAGYFSGLCWFSSIMLINKTLVFFKLFKENHHQVN